MYQLKMEELQQRRLRLENFYDVVKKHMDQCHIERMKVLEVAELAANKSFEPGLSLDERSLFVEMSKVAMSQLPLFGDRANESLAKLVEGLQALPNVDIKGYLEG